VEICGARVDARAPKRRLRRPAIAVIFLGIGSQLKMPLDRTPDHGTAYVPEAGPLPTRSTGYWLPDDHLDLYYSFDKPRYRWRGEGALNGVRYVGVPEPTLTIPAGSLVRLSLSHPYAPPGLPSGFWLQLSGWFTR